MISSPINLRCEYRKNPMAVDVEKPRLSWNFASEGAMFHQAAYQIVVTSKSSQSGVLWDTGKVIGPQMSQIPYEGQKVHPNQEVEWKVRIWSDDGTPSSWSKSAKWSGGVASVWKAKWITTKDAADTPEIIPLTGANWIMHPDDGINEKSFTRWVKFNFQAPQDLKEAWLLLSVDDEHNAWLNGAKVSESKEFMHYQILDIRKQLKSGSNELLLEAYNEAGIGATIGKVVLRGSGGEKVFSSDSTWTYSKSKSGPFVASKVHGAYGCAPWGAISGLTKFEMTPAPIFRHEVTLEKQVKRATFYASALGLYELTINGKTLNPGCLSPGWTDYRKRVYYIPYDVTKILKGGGNTISATVGDGWYAGYLGYTGRRHFYGGDVGFAGQLEIEYSDGSHETVFTDRNWQVSTGEVVHSDLLMGTKIDYSRQPTVWEKVGLLKLKPIVITTHPNGDVSPKRLSVAKTIKATKDGKYICDFGENIVGVVRLMINGKKGQHITLRHAEMLNPDGTLYTENLRAAKATDEFILAKSGLQTIEPKFTFHGFQYAEISGLTSAPATQDVHAVILHSDIDQAMKFDSDNGLLNKLVGNSDRSQEGNFLDVPTDCPQRDERLGWTGDAQVYAKTAMMNRNSFGFYTKWLVDLCTDSQMENGEYSDVAPAIQRGGNAGWEDAGVVTTYRMFEMADDVRVIRQHWDSLNRFMEHLKTVSPGYIRPPGGYGDWLLLKGLQHSSAISTTYYYTDSKMMAEMAGAIGEYDRQNAYRALCEKIAAAYRAKFVQVDERILDQNQESQSIYVTALDAGLVGRKSGTDHLVRLIRDNGGKIATGFLGTPQILQVLVDGGESDLAYKLLLNEQYPSWLYQVKIGATSMWERWDGWKPETGFQDKGMNSFNHYWLGCVNEFIYSRLAGLPSRYKPGERILIRPAFTQKMNWVSAEYQSMLGSFKCEWKRTGKQIIFKATVPANVTVDVRLPFGAKCMQGAKTVDRNLFRMTNTHAEYTVDEK